MAAITNYHKLRGIKQHTFIILKFYRLEFRDRSHWAKITVLAGLHSLLEALGGNLFSWHFQLLEAACIPWLRAPSPDFESQQHYVSDHSSTDYARERLFALKDSRD